MALMAPTAEEQLNLDQAGFHQGHSTSGQLLNLTQYIEDGFEEKQITGTVSVDLTGSFHRAPLLTNGPVYRPGGNRRYI